jgi:hypothetical protein
MNKTDPLQIFPAIKKKEGILHINHMHISIFLKSTEGKKFSKFKQ